MSNHNYYYSLLGGSRAINIPVTNLNWTTEIRNNTTVITNPPPGCEDMGWSITTQNTRLRYNIVDSQNCPPGTCNIVQAGSALAIIQVGGTPTTFSISFNGRGEVQAPSVFEVLNFYLDPSSITNMTTSGRTRIGGASAPGGGLGCGVGEPVVKDFSAPLPYTASPYLSSLSSGVYSLIMPANSIWSLFVDFTTGDTLYHVNCYYEIYLSFS